MHLTSILTVPLTLPLHPIRTLTPPLILTVTLTVTLILQVQQRATRERDMQPSDMLRRCPLPPYDE